MLPTPVYFTVFFISKSFILICVALKVPWNLQKRMVFRDPTEVLFVMRHNSIWLLLHFCVFSAGFFICAYYIPWKLGQGFRGPDCSGAEWSVNTVRADMAPEPLPPAFPWVHREEWLLLMSLASSWFYNCALFSRSWYLLISQLYCFLQLQSATPECEDLPKVFIFSSKDQVGSSQKE